VTEGDFLAPLKGYCARIDNKELLRDNPAFFRPDIVTWIYDSQVQSDTYAESLWRRAAPGSSYVLSAPQTA